MKKILIWVFGLAGILTMIYLAMNSLLKSEDEVVHDQPIDREEQKLKILVSFAKLYGYVRFFHPSDEATQMDWDLFAIYGAKRIKEAKNDEEFIRILEELFLPIAPTMEIASDGKDMESKQMEKQSNQVIAWQHLGVGTSNQHSNPIYESRRVPATIEKGKLILGEEKLFDPYPKVDEAIYKEISPGVIVKIPLVLFIRDGKTIGTTEESLTNFQKLKTKLTQVSLETSESEHVRLAGIIITWNMFQHFYPYFHLTDTNWDEQLEQALRKTTDDKNKKDYIQSLSSLLVHTEDAHAELSHQKYSPRDEKLPFVVDFIEGEIVVTAAEEESGLLPGDIIVSMNQRKALEIFEDFKKDIVGSPQFKNFVASYYFTYGNQVKIEINRDKEKFIAEVDGKAGINIDEFHRKEDFKELDKGIYYVNLLSEHASLIIGENSEKLAQAKGVIFDLRGYPDLDLMHQVIGHLIEEPVTGPIYKVPQFIYPDREKVTYFEWIEPILPNPPQFSGKIVFLTYSGAISRPEYFLSFIKDNKLGDIVGQPTAGATGYAQAFAIPGNIIIYFTGLEVLSKNRVPIHISGIEPTVEIERTIAGVREGVDEYIEKAIEFIHR